MALKGDTLRISSPAFQMNARIPKQFTADGADKSPPLEWSGAPKGTQQFALVLHDPDAPLPGGFTHWVLYGMVASTTKLPEGQPADAFTGGLNGAGSPGYMGPAPPKGSGVHHYHFWLYALDTDAKMKPGLDKEQLALAMKDHIIEETRLVGVYER